MTPRWLAGILILGVTAAAADLRLPVHKLSLARESRTVKITLTLFDDRECVLQVIDNSTTGTPRFKSLELAAHATGAIAGCNGGFFNQQPLRPVGGFIAGGKTRSAVDHASWMKGLVLVREDAWSLEVTADLATVTGITGLVQSGPWLWRTGTPEMDLERKKWAPRTFICRDGEHTGALGFCDGETLQGLALLLTSPEIRALIRIQRALNLDGGPSSGLWVAGKTRATYLAESWPVANYLLITPRRTP